MDGRSPIKLSKGHKVVEQTSCMERKFLDNKMFELVILEVKPLWVMS